MSEMQNIQWFPGHMKKTERQIEKVLPLIDAVAEIADARIPVSSRNPDLAGIVADKPRLILLNKCDIADKAATDRWINHFKNQGIIAIPMDCRTGKGVDNFVRSVKNLLAERLEAYDKKGMTGKPLRVAVVGVPNVGKSSFINRMSKISKAGVADRPGVTRGNQWFKIDERLELLDTPGVLWPKFQDPKVGEHLAFTGAVKDDVIDKELLAVRLLECMSQEYPDRLLERYKVDPSEFYDAYDLLQAIGKKRGMMMRGGEVDCERASTMLLDEYRGGKLGNITLEMPEDK
ncbi:MAG: ribosome biogenesis GTPase YlqF [Clostridia bacterium]|nr:ribosome biogenesis GTPase YlqF [Clostridia bacterium]